ncbi:MAG: sigma-70 family RNA polymerase sigma factor [Planctomycetota bacterium]
MGDAMMMDDEQLVNAALAGDMSAFGGLVTRYKDACFGAAYAILGNFHDAEDFTQEAFVRAFQNLERLKDRRKFAPWLCSIAINLCRDWLKRTRPGAISNETQESLHSAEDSPMDETAKFDVKEIVQKAIADLPEQSRMVTTLFYVNGYSQEQVGEFLGIPVGTVKSRLSKARNILKERLIGMVEQTLKTARPGDKYPEHIVELLQRPRPMDMAGHPVRKIWEMIRDALPGYEVVEGKEVESVEETRQALNMENQDPIFYRAYKVDDDQYLRTQMTVTAILEMKGRKLPVKLLAPGRVFRPDKEDERHLKVFHQVDVLHLDRGVTRAMLIESIAKVSRGIFGNVEMRHRAPEKDFFGVCDSLEIDIQYQGEWVEVAGAGMILPDVIARAGYDPDQVAGYGFGVGIERLAMVKWNMDDVRELVPKVD